MSSREKPMERHEYGRRCDRRVKRVGATGCAVSVSSTAFKRAQGDATCVRAPYQRVPAAPNRLTWPFSSAGPDRVWVADITYVPTRQGWLYLAAVLDLYSRRIVGWAMSDRPEQALTCNALMMAPGRRCPAPGAIHHSDQGAQYTSRAYRKQLTDAGLLASLSRKGIPCDNAMMERFFSSLKQELIHHERFKDRDTARAAIFQYIESFYNRQRLHSSLGYRSPEAFERMAEVTN